MDRRKEERVGRLYQTLIDVRDELFESTEKLIESIKPHIDYVKANPGSTQIDVGSIINYEIEVSQVLTDLNLQVLKALKNVSVPVLSLANDKNSNQNHTSLDVKTAQTSSSRISQELKDFFKNNSCSASSNKQAVGNNTQQRISLDNKLLRIVCANLEQTQISAEQSNADFGLCGKSSDSSNNVRIISSSPTQLSETELSSTESSGSYQHPLLRIQLTSKEVKDVNSEIQALKENMKRFSEKLANENTVGDTQETFHKDIPSLNFHYETPVKEDSTAFQAESLPGPSNVSDSTTNKNTVSADNTTKQLDCFQKIKVNSIKSDEVPEKLVETDNAANTVSYNDHRPEYFDNHVTQDDVSTSKQPPTRSEIATALDKLLSKQRHDRHQEVIQKALESVPDIRLVPAEPPTVAKTSTDSSSASSISGRKHKSPAKNKVENATFDLTKPKLPQNGEVCVFSHIESPTEFYLQIINEYTVKAMDHINSIMSQKLKGTNLEFVSKEDAFSKLGKYCIGYVLEKKGWFRLEVLDWKLGNQTKEIEVYSVDFGFKVRISYTYLRSMISTLTEIPMLAVRCYFPYLYPPGSTFKIKLSEWPEESIDTMKTIANFSGVYGEEETLKWFRISFVMHDGDKAAVELHELEEENKNHESFGEYLLNFQAAVEIEDSYDDPTLEEFLEDVDDLENADNLNELVLGYDAQDEARICRFSRKDGTCYKGKNCNLEHAELPKDGFTTDQLPIHRITIDNLEQPLKGDIFQVLITGWIDSCTYWVQIIKNPVRDNAGLLMDRDLKDLIAAMNQRKMSAKFEPFKVAPALGEIVLVCHKVTKVWMRGVVRSLEINEIGDPQVAEVFTVDFGESFNVKIKELRQMIDEFVRLPFQAIQIYLYNYEHNPDCLNAQAYNFFVKHIEYKNFLAQFRSSNSPWSVKLTTLKGHEIGATLLREEFAIRRQRDLQVDGEYLLQLE